jgi:hypothetical protein
MTNDSNLQLSSDNAQIDLMRLLRIFMVGLCCAATLLLSVPARAQNTEITRFRTMHGDVSHIENVAGASFLNFSQKGGMVSLPPDWKNVNVDDVMNLHGQTAILMSHSQGLCGSRSSLLVVTSQALLGPYPLGECEDVLIHQRSEDGKSLIVIRAEQVGGLAWLYSSDETSFRGPAKIVLPESLKLMLPQEISEPQLSDKSNLPQITNKTVMSQQHQSAPLPPVTRAVSAPKKVPEGLTSPNSFTAPPAPSRPATQTAMKTEQVRRESTGKLSAKEAKKVIEDVKTSTPPQQPKIIISL